MPPAKGRREARINGSSQSDAGKSAPHGRLSSPKTVRDTLLLLLSAAAGCVDALSYLGLGQVFTANMTGNTVLFGIALGQAKGEEALRGGVALAGFVLGVAGGAMITEGKLEGRSVWPRAVTVALAFELVVMVAFALGFYLTGGGPSGGARYLIIALSALAMGVQSTAVRSLGVGGVASTYITGTLTSLTEQVISRARMSLLSRESGEQRTEQRTTPNRNPAAILACVWMVYALGALVSGAAMLRWPSGTVFMPVVLVALVIATAILRFGHYQHEEGSKSLSERRIEEV
jgi:uncharacterized membrane protein YoaK (UPF0700 family)